jgi:uncharacterized membrane protein
MDFGTGSDRLAQNKTLTTVVYALYALSLFTAGTAVIAVIINYVKQDEVRGTFLESHFRWQIRTFWLALAGCVIGWITVWLLVGWLILAATWLWVAYRVVRGWLALNDDEPIDAVY